LPDPVRPGAEGPGLSVELGWSKDPNAGHDYRGGLVTGVIAPDSNSRMRLVAATPGPGLTASAPPSPNSIPNNHLSYAIQWFLFPGVSLVISIPALGRNRASKTCPGKVAAETALAKIKFMLDAMEAHTGKRPIIYTDPKFHREVLEGEFADSPFLREKPGQLQVMVAVPDLRGVDESPTEMIVTPTTGGVAANVTANVPPSAGITLGESVGAAALA